MTLPKRDENTKGIYMAYMKSFIAILWPKRCFRGVVPRQKVTFSMNMV